MLLELLEQLVADRLLLLSGVMPLSRGAPGGYAEHETRHQEKSQELQDLGSWGHNPSSLNVDTIPCPGHATTTRRRGPSGEKVSRVLRPQRPAKGWFCSPSLVTGRGDLPRSGDAGTSANSRPPHKRWVTLVVGVGDVTLAGGPEALGVGGAHAPPGLHGGRGTNGHRATHRPHQPLGRGAWFLARALRALAAARRCLLRRRRPRGAGRTRLERAASHTAKAKPLTAHQKAVGRRELARRVKLNPRVILTPGFIKKAVILNFDMPLRLRLDPTVVLPNQVCGQRALNAGCTAPVTDPALGGLDNADDLMQTDLTAENDPPTPLGADTVWAPPVPSRIAGTVDVTMHFDKETAGFGDPGTFELTLDWFNLTATGFDLIQDSTGCALLRTAPTFAITPAEQTSGSFNVLTRDLLPAAAHPLRLQRAAARHVRRRRSPGPRRSPAPTTRRSRWSSRAGSRSARPSRSTASCASARSPSSTGPARRRRTSSPTSTPAPWRRARRDHLAAAPRHLRRHPDRRARHPLAREAAELHERGHVR